MPARRRVRKRKIDPARVRSRLYEIVLDGADKDAVAAARVLLADRTHEEAAPDVDMLDDIRQALIKDGL